jgi:hypothetical protein
LPPEYPLPLDLTATPDGMPFLCRFGSGFEWRDGKLFVLFATPGGPVFHQMLAAGESRRLLEWMLASAEVGSG